MKILIAEDDPVSRRLLQATLNKWGYQVTITANGKEAWQALQTPEAPSLLILDWLM
ncbi:MAG TPA: response regulator, partial [Candidatus Binatia bacterium]|nr:response regulator [Candidatus Binatia bacterium]